MSRVTRFGVGGRPACSKAVQQGPVPAKEYVEGRLKDTFLPSPAVDGIAWRMANASARGGPPRVSKVRIVEPSEKKNSGLLSRGLAIC